MRNPVGLSVAPQCLRSPDGRESCQLIIVKMGHLRRTARLSHGTAWKPHQIRAGCGAALSRDVQPAGRADDDILSVNLERGFSW
jgi:hypothetical protein